LIGEKGSDVIRTYERSLLSLLLTTMTVTLVNPSFAAMVELATLGGGYVTLSAGVEHKWVKDIVDFVAKSAGRLKMLPNKQVRGISYLGNNVPLWYPSTPWIRLILSPAYDLSSIYKHYSVDYLDYSVISRYEKRDNYIVSSVLDSTSPFYVYNPLTVDGALRQSRKAFLVESSQALSFDPVEDKRCFHAPWFVDYSGDWSEIEGKEWKVRGNIAVDVREIKREASFEVSGTYLSRRCRNSLPKGFVWTPFEEYASHWVTYHTNVPRKKWGIEIVRTDQNLFVCFDHVKPVKDVYKVFSDLGVFQFVRDKHGVYQDFEERVERDELLGVELLDWAWQLPDGSFCAPDESSQAGLIHVPRRGESMVYDSQIHSRVFFTERGSFIDVTSCPSGTLFLLPQSTALSRVCALASIYNRPLPVQFPHQQGVRENSISEQISYDKLSFRLRSFMESQVVRAETDRTYTVGQLAREFSVPISAVLWHLNRTPDYYCWHADGAVRSTFVLVDGLQLYFPGEVVDGCIDGRRWSTIVNSLKIGSNFLRSQKRSYIRFVRFLERNGVSVSISHHSAYDELCCEVGSRF